MVKRKADVLEQKSPAEFFAENKNIAGFDNVSLLPADLLIMQRVCMCLASLLHGPNLLTELRGSIADL